MPWAPPPLVPDTAPPAATRCLACGTEVGIGFVACPACGALLHSEKLKRLASAAEAATTPAEALANWREALALLPADSRQRQAVLARIEALARVSDRSPTAAKGSSGWSKAAGGVGAVGVLLAKFKFIILLVLTKAKLLLLGLTKLSTLLSMLVSFGLYWSLWGWRFAAGFIVSIYIHEMGHVAALTRLGIKASAPMFIPGFGAVVRLRENLPTAREDARVGLAGPIWGLGAAVGAWLLGQAFESPLMGAVAQVGAYINLFNLTPIWQLDGARAWRALTQRQRWIAAGAVLAALLLSSHQAHGALILVAICAIGQLFSKSAPLEPNREALTEYIVLIAALSLIASLPVPASNGR